MKAVRAAGERGQIFTVCVAEDFEPPGTEQVGILIENGFTWDRPFSDAWTVDMIYVGGNLHLLDITGTIRIRNGAGCWTEVRGPDVDGLYSLAVLVGKLVLTGEMGRIYVLNDGRWEQRTSDRTDSLMKALTVNGSGFIGGANGVLIRLSEKDLRVVQLEGSADVTDIAVFDDRTIVCAAGWNGRREGQLHFVDTQDLKRRTVETPERFFMLAPCAPAQFLWENGRIHRWEDGSFSLCTEILNETSFLTSIETQPVCGDVDGVLFAYHNDRWNRLGQVGL